MTSNDISKGILKTLLILMGIALLLWFIFTIKLLIIHIIIALVVSFMGHPVVDFLEKRLRFRKNLAVILTMFLFLILIAGFVFLCIPLIKSQGETLALINVDKIKQDFINLYNEFQQYLKDRGITAYDDLATNLFDYINVIVPSMLNSLAKNVKYIGITIFNVSFISFFFMKDDHMFERMLMTTFPKRNKDKVLKSLQKIKKLLSSYFVGLCFQIVILLTIYSIILIIFGVKNAILTALLCALLNLIPYIGPLVGAVLITFSTMTSFLGADLYDTIIPKTIYVLIGFIIGQLVDVLFSQPFIFSKSVKSHPLEIFLIIIIGGMLYGVIGMMFAVPLYTSIKVVTKEFLADNNIVKSLTKNI